MKKLDRFSRDKYETTIHKHTLKENGVKLLSAMENIPDSPEGIILESLLEGMNQYYSAELSQKVHRGLNESYRKGQVYRRLSYLWLQGYTAVVLAKDFKAKGIRTKKGLYITDKKIYKILSNTKYNGKVKRRKNVLVP